VATLPPDFVRYCCDLLNAAGTVMARRMFGGYGLSVQGMNFAIIIADTLYLKVDPTTQAQFAQVGSVPFTYEKRTGGVAVMSYFTAPTEAMESPAEMAHWARLALAAAQRAALKKPAAKAPQKVAAKSAKKTKSAPQV
jgi:DNA transformation protein and related proteins